MLFSKAILLLSAAISPFALADTSSPSTPAPTTVTVKVINAHSTPTPSSTPLYTSKFIASTGTGGHAVPTLGRWNITAPAISSAVKVPVASEVTAATTVAPAPSSTGGASSREVASAMMAGVIAIAGLVML